MVLWSCPFERDGRLGFNQDSFFVGLLCIPNSLSPFAQKYFQGSQGRTKSV